MRYLISTFIGIAILFGSFVGVKDFSSNSDNESNNPTTQVIDTILPAVQEAAQVELQQTDVSMDNHDNVNPAEMVNFARTLIGTPYVYGSMNPAAGFDCSGFINYVTNHFGLKVPRSSVDFTNYGTEVSRNAAMPGDLILFTGTDVSKHVVGHIGMVTENSANGLEFIHSSSGKSNGVTLSPLSGYYETRFVKIIRVVA